MPVGTGDDGPSEKAVPIAECGLLQRRRNRRVRYCMNQPWLTTKDWPVKALLGKAANR